MDRVYITKIIQGVLESTFTGSIKRKIIQHHDRLQYRCPYCMEGKTESKKRCNLYWNKLIIICFRCGKKTNFDRFCKDFHQQLDPDKKMEIIDHLNKNITYSDAQNDLSDADFDKLINISDLSNILNSGESNITNFGPIVTNSPVYKYLINRGISAKYHKDIWQGKYWKGSEIWEPIICLLNRRGDKVLSMQVRNLKEGKRRFFKIYNFENLYKWVNHIEGDEIPDMDINEIISYNKIGAYFNILNIDFDKKITVFEGYIDSLFFPNSIGVVGVNTDFDMLENNNLELQYFFDNDEAGFKAAEIKIKAGYPVFLWKKLFQSIVEKKNDGDPYGLLHRISKVKDLNKLAELVNNPYKTLNLDSMFSKDIYDIKWIPKKEKKTWTNYTKSHQ